MIERLVIFAGLVLVGFAVWHLFNARWVGRAAARAIRDPLLTNYMHGTPGVVLFTADYCSPCKTQQQPAIKRLVEEIGADNVQYIQVDVEADPDAAQRWGVMSLPTTVILDESGTPRDVNHGVASTEKLKRQLQTLKPVS